MEELSAGKKMSGLEEFVGRLFLVMYYLLSLIFKNPVEK
jgi:hypothetical protein